VNEDWYKVDGWMMVMMAKLGLEEVTFTVDEMKQYNSAIAHLVISLGKYEVKDDKIRVFMNTQDAKLKQALFDIFKAPYNPKAVIITGPPGGYYSGDKK
jgi:hypothetical protein